VPVVTALDSSRSTAPTRRLGRKAEQTLTAADVSVCGTCHADGVVREEAARLQAAAPPELEDHHEPGRGRRLVPPAALTTPNRCPLSVRTPTVTA
jgi:hypothetical protein